jgi:serine/threonine protein kinase
MKQKISPMNDIISKSSSTSEEPEDIDGEGFELLKKMLNLDKRERISAEEALKHRYLKSVRNS